ncbi:MAG: cysteine desulfurase [Candidatus Aenigmarchaeota archaeon]|nr:cysteine desulfurase [Candidatus Aenigmarchaeota archaeon]
MHKTKIILDIDRIKKDFPIFSQKINGHSLVYLDSAATAQKPSLVIEETTRFYTEYNSNIHRGAHKLGELATIAYEEAHEKIAKFLGADIEEIIFTAGTTESLNLVAYSLVKTLKQGDKIVLTEMEHHSNIVPWQQLAKQYGVNIEYIKVKDFQLDIEHAKKIIDSKTKIVSVMHASNVLGTINPIKELAKITHDIGALFVVDAAHSAPNMKINVKDIDCDFLAFSGHKICGPTGIGVLYGKKHLLDKMSPFLYGGHMISEVTLKDTTFADVPSKFESGTSNIAGAIGLGYAIDYINKIGLENIHYYETELAKYAIETLKKIVGVKIYGPDENRTGVISFNISGIHAHDVATILDREGIAIRSGNHCAMPLMNALGINACNRASIYFYNTFDDIDNLVEAIKKAKKIFKVTNETSE